jgi:pre-rRNA-processing protein TSR2
MEDVETVLLQVMIDEFEVNVDDDSATDVADNIVRARAECANGQFDGVNKLSQRFQNLKGNTVDQMFKKAEDADQDTDWESDDDDEEQDEEGDVDMSDAPAPAPAAARREKPTAEVDEDGFTKVMHKKR